MYLLLSRCVGVRSRLHGDVIKWKHFPRYWPFVWGIHRSPLNSPHKGQWRGTLMFSLTCAAINSWVNNGEAGDFRRHCAHHNVTVMTRAYIFRHIKYIEITVQWSVQLHIQYLGNEDMYMCNYIHVYIYMFRSSWNNDQLTSHLPNASVANELQLTNMDKYTSDILYGWLCARLWNIHY